MAVSEQAVHEALSGLVAPDNIEGIRETGGKVLLTLAVNVPMAEKPAFAERVKEAVRAVEGVKDVFVSFAAAAEPAAQAPAGPAPLGGIKRVIAVGAGKGGVGKSTVAVNLAVALAKAGHQVGLLDADVYGPSAAIMTGTRDHRAQGDAQQRVIPAIRHGIRVISIAFLMPKEQAAVVWRGPMVGKMVQQLLTGVAWGELDYLIVDLPPGTGDAVLSLAQATPLTGAVVVTTPQDVALLDVEKAIEMFDAVKVPVLGVVENMSGFTCPECGHVTGNFNLPLLGRLPLDPTVPPGGDSGIPIVIEHPQGKPAEAFLSLAGAVERRVAELAQQGAPQVDLNWS
jgi:ATP-binding protein involved in chromosome partitioning